MLKYGCKINGYRSVITLEENVSSLSKAHLFLAPASYVA